MIINKFKNVLSEELGIPVDSQMIINALSDIKPGLKHSNGIDEELMEYAREKIKKSVSGNSTEVKKEAKKETKKETKKEASNQAPKKETKKEAKKANKK